MPAFSVDKPGIKEFAIVGGGTLAVILAWRWWSNRQAGHAAAGTGTTGQPQAGTQPYGGSTPTGLSLGALLLWLQDHMSSTTTTKTTTTPSTPTPVPVPKPKPRPKPKPKGKAA